MIESYQKQKYCVECGDTFMIYTKAGEQKKYCGYQCQSTYLRRKKEMKTHESIPPKNT